MTDQTYQLVVRRGPQEGHVFPLTGDMMTIGRDPMSDITLNDPEVSRQHARLARLSDGGFEIQDLGSTNGTFIDGNRLGGERVRLSPGQVLVLGSNVSLVLEAVPGQMETVVAQRSDFDLESFAEPEPLAPPVAELEPEPEPEEEMEPAVDEAPVVTDKLDAEMAPPVPPPVTPEEPEPAGEEPAFAAPDMDHEATIIDQSFEKPSYPVFEVPEEPEVPDFSAEPEPLPAYDDDAAKTILDAGAAMPPPPTPQESPVFPAQETAEPFTPPPYQASTPPPPPPAPVAADLEGGESDNRNRNIIIIVVALILLCCCCSLIVGGWYFGDAFIQFLEDLGLVGLPLDTLMALVA